MKHLLWETKLDEAEALIRPRAFEDLSMMLAYCEVALWRQFLHEKEENRVETSKRLELLDAYSTAAYNRLAPEKKGFFGGSSHEPDVLAALAKITPSERELAFVDAALAISFVPICLAVVEFRIATKSAFIKGFFFVLFLCAK